MNIRRLFWLGAAILFSVAALVAIVAVVGGDFGDTQARILETCGLAFACGAVVLSGLACMDRGVIRPVAFGAIVLGAATFAILTAAVWHDVSSSAYGKAAAVLSAWTTAALLATTLRLLVSSPRLLHTLVPATWAAAALAAAFGTVMILRDDGGAWQIEVVLVILTLLGYALTPVLQRFSTRDEPGPSSERFIGTLGSVDVFAVRGWGRSVTIGSTRTPLASGEGIVLREHP